MARVAVRLRARRSLSRARSNRRTGRSSSERVSMVAKLSRVRRPRRPSGGAGCAARHPTGSGSTTTRSNRTGSGRNRRPTGSGRPRAAGRAPRDRWPRLRWSTVSSGEAESRRRRQRTSTITSIGGGPGSTATRSSSWRPTWTFRARTVQPASLSRAATRASAVSPASCAVVRVRAEGRPSTVDRASRRSSAAITRRSPGAHPALTWPPAPARRDRRGRAPRRRP